MFVYHRNPLISHSLSCRELNETSDGKISDALQEASFFKSQMLCYLIIIMISGLDEKHRGKTCFYYRDGLRIQAESEVHIENPNALSVCCWGLLLLLLLISCGTLFSLIEITNEA